MIAARESVGGSAAAHLLDNLLACDNQADAGRKITIFLRRLGNVRGTQERLDAAAGASLVLADLILLGVAAVCEREGSTSAHVATIHGHRAGRLIIESASLMVRQREERLDCLTNREDAQAAKLKVPQRKVAQQGGTLERTFNELDFTTFFIAGIGNFFDRFGCFVSPILPALSVFILLGGHHD